MTSQPQPGTQAGAPGTDAVLAAGQLAGQVARRWRTIDSLLPPPGELPAGCGARLAVSAGGEVIARAACEHWRAAPGSIDMSLGAARRFRLSVRIAGPDLPAALDKLLAQWRQHLAGVPGSRAEDTAAVIAWPSREVSGINVLLRHGFTAHTVTAARVPGPALPDARPAGRAVPDGVVIRRAGAADTGAVVRLGLEPFRYDAQFGCVVVRPDTEQALRRDAQLALAEPVPWIWLAERGGEAIGLIQAQPPHAALTAAPLTAVRPAAYLAIGAVLPAERGKGVGSALAAAAHRDFDHGGVAVTLLDYEQYNPLSVPFWSQHGYRPLWTSWEARPGRPAPLAG